MADLDEHSSKEHKEPVNHACEVCQSSFVSPNELLKHKDVHKKQTVHTCDICQKIFQSASALSGHNEVHNQPTIHACDICMNTFGSINDLQIHKVMHIQDNSGKVYVDQSYLDSILSKNAKLEKELDNLKEDFERLNDIFETSKNTSKSVGQASDIELAKVREEFRIAKTENEFLVEKNETLFKLGKIALDQNKKDVPEMEVIDDQDEDGLDTLVASSVENKNRGFRRNNPATFADKVAASKQNTKPQQEKTHETRPNVNSEASSTSSPNVQTNGSNAKISYCHYFSNYGKCTYEEKSGNPCKFSHEKAPQCSFNERCNREKCMYSHSKQRQAPNHQRKSPFLFQGAGRQPKRQMNQFQDLMAPLMEMMWGMHGQRQNGRRY